MKRLLLVLCLAAPLAGCHEFKDDVLLICDSPDHVKFPENAKNPQKLQLIGVYLYDNVSTKEGKMFVDYLALVGRAERSKTLRKIAMKEGITICHLADMP